MSAASAAEGATTASDEVTSSKKKQGATEAGKTKVFSGAIALLLYFHFLFFVQKACKREMTFKCRIHKN